MFLFQGRNNKQKSNLPQQKNERQNTIPKQLGGLGSHLVVSADITFWYRSKAIIDKLNELAIMAIVFPIGTKPHMNFPSSCKVFRNV